jgi:hypothetical protein
MLTHTVVQLYDATQWRDSISKVDKQASVLYSIEPVPHCFITASRFENRHGSGLWRLCPNVLDT